MTNPLHKIIGDLLKHGITTHATPAEYKTISDRVQFYHLTISNHLSYYKALPDAGKLRFLKRVYHFIEARQFHYVNIESVPEMPVLVSAAAVQLTFGLRSYLLPFFRNIYIVADAYYVRDFDFPVVGHVSPTGIHISWKYFLEGFKNDTDGVNTALHEMSHALRHQNSMKKFGIDKEFHADFATYTRQYGPILIEALLHRRSFLRSYAFTNFEEFWAVSVETFFEMPSALKASLPDLYRALCEVLNQDPMTEKKVLPSAATGR
jgi:Mlc titration factor MtfA (ptsG expression regulator)